MLRPHAGSLALVACLAFASPSPSHARVDAFASDSCGFTIRFNLQYYGPGARPLFADNARAGILECWSGHRFGCCPVNIEVNSLIDGPREPGYDSIYVYRDTALGDHVSRAELGAVNDGDHYGIWSDKEISRTYGHEVGHLAGFDDKYTVVSGDIVQVNGKEVDTRVVEPRPGWERDKMARLYGSAAWMVFRILNEAGFNCPNTCWPMDTAGGEMSSSAFAESAPIPKPSEGPSTSVWVIPTDGVYVFIRSANAGGGLVFVPETGGRLVLSLDSLAAADLNPTASQDSSTLRVDTLRVDIPSFAWADGESLVGKFGVAERSPLMTGPNVLSLADSHLVAEGFVAGRGGVIDDATGFFRALVGMKLVNDLFPASSPLFVDVPLFGQINYDFGLMFFALELSPFVNLGLTGLPIPGPNPDPDQPPSPEVRSGLTLSAAPNPFRGETTIRYQIPATSPVGLSVFDVAGRRVRSLVAGAQIAGPHAVAWDGRGDDGERLQHGVYILRLESGGVVSSGKLVLVR